jgi:hypothetical protein
MGNAGSAAKDGNVTYCSLTCCSNKQWISYCKLAKLLLLNLCGHVDNVTVSALSPPLLLFLSDHHVLKET